MQPWLCRILQGPALWLTPVCIDCRLNLGGVQKGGLPIQHSAARAGAGENSRGARRQGGSGPPGPPVPKKKKKKKKRRITGEGEKKAGEEERRKNATDAAQTSPGVRSDQDFEADPAAVTRDGWRYRYASLP
ncbi:unnamed protein product [Prorocentrum cordatum]|uniref:Uncharacterized protein n=1 Tax=Prorocentrum cordatum TaxID=2364126 RepID=A0ABN9TNN5_9DINO|nr:unnamed protein product [Polarella glacialis]